MDGHDTKLYYLNLGCGNRFHPSWLNIDIEASGSEVVSHDLTRGIPIASDTCEVVYHAHLLEHLRRPDALRFMRECYRVLKPGGILRVAVPDLERICREYLNQLELAVNDVDGSSANHEWMILELYDQTVREKGGGEMRTFLAASDLPNESFVYERIGEEGREMMEAVGRPKSDGLTPRANISRSRLVASLRYRLGLLRKFITHQFLALMLGERGPRALDIGAFRLGGEVHQWMYDRYSLARLMKEAGFRDPIQQSATRSQIVDWQKFSLDTLADGTVIKPDSLFMEATKP